MLIGRLPFKSRFESEQAREDGVIGHGRTPRACASLQARPGTTRLGGADGDFSMAPCWENESVKVVRPASLRTDTLPLCAEAIERTMAKPSPLPPSRRVRDGSTR